MGSMLPYIAYMDPMGTMMLHDVFHIFLNRDKPIIESPHDAIMAKVPRPPRSRVLPWSWY